ncbi:hypothetical protein DBR17_14395, partial [Sphingomonas sp. HMWF008]
MALAQIAVEQDGQVKMIDGAKAFSRRATLGLFGSTMLVAAAPAFARGDDASQRLRTLLDDSEAADARLDPLSAARKGKAATGPLFVDPLSDAYGATLLANKKGELARLEAIDRAALPPVDQIAY